MNLRLIGPTVNEYTDLGITEDILTRRANSIIRKLEEDDEVTIFVCLTKDIVFIIAPNNKIMEKVKLDQLGERVESSEILTLTGAPNHTVTDMIEKWDNGSPDDALLILEKFLLDTF